MALYQNITITQAGASLMSRILTEGGTPLTFEAVAVGSGELATGADTATFTALISEAKRLPVEAVERNGGRITVSARLATDTLTSDLYQREVGIYANGILFAYGNTGDKYDFVPATGKNAAVQKVIRVPLAIGTMQTTFAEMDSTDLMTHAAFNSRLQETIPGMVTEYMNTLVNGGGDIDFFLTVDATYKPTSPYAQSGTSVAQAVGELEEKSALLASSNKFTGTNTFSGTTIYAGQAQFQKDTIFTGLDNYFGSGLRALPLGVKNALGQDAYGLSITPPASDGSGGGLQLWGVQFMQGDNWGNTALKMVHNEISLTSLTESAIGFDYSNVVHFRTFPNDGSAANDGQGAIFDFRAWQWDNDTHDTANGYCPVQILKTSAGSLQGESVLNRDEMDARYTPLTHPLISTLSTNDEGIKATGWIIMPASPAANIGLQINRIAISVSNAGSSTSVWANAINNANCGVTAKVDSLNTQKINIEAISAGNKGNNIRLSVDSTSGATASGFYLRGGQNPANAEKTADSLLAIARNNNAPENGYRLYSESEITEIPANVDLSRVIQGMQIFYYSKLKNAEKTFMPSVLTMYEAFAYSTELESIAGSTFYNCLNAFCAFKGCTKLHNIENITFSHVRYAGGAFYECSSLVTTSTLSLITLEDGHEMFYKCTSLEDIVGTDLRSLRRADNMFKGCILNLESVLHLADTINTVPSGNITIGINAELKGNSEIATALETIRGKGWTVTEEYNTKTA